MSLSSRAFAIALAALAISPAVAAADSIVYVKDGNVWLASGSGGNHYQVTTDGTAEHPYRSPSQADDGTIAAGFGNEILRMRQNGDVLNRLDPPALMNSVSHSMDGVPVEVAISPDGTKVAYTFAGYECPVGASCGARSATGIIPSDRNVDSPVFGSSFFRNPSWVTNTRILNSGGFGSHINIQDLGAESFNWVNDMETDLGNAEVNPQGTGLVAVRGYDETTSVVWYDVNGVQSGGKPADPVARCVGYAVGLDDPMWSPDGTAVAWTEHDGIWVKRDAASCETPKPALVIPGAGEGDWGPAAVNPGPRSGGGGDGGPIGVDDPAIAAVRLGKARLKGKKVRVSVTCAADCRYTAKLTLARRTVAKKSGKAKAGRAKTVTLRISGRSARKARRAGKGLKLTVRAGGGSRTVSVKTR
jgi:hypothetical protein